MIDLTPAAIGPYVVPAGQPATSTSDEPQRQHGDLRRAGDHPDRRRGRRRSRRCTTREIVASIASKSAGPGTRANIDEFTETTAKALEVVGGADRGKAIIVLNPAEPPLIMRDTVLLPRSATPTSMPSKAASSAMVDDVPPTCPGYRLKQDGAVPPDRRR